MDRTLADPVERNSHCHELLTRDDALPPSATEAGEMQHKSLTTKGENCSRMLIDQTSGLTATDIAAWVGAVAGVAAVVWDFYKWKTCGPKLDLSAGAGMKMVVAGRRSHTSDDSDYILVKVRNNGTAKTTITTLSLATYDSW